MIIKIPFHDRFIIEIASGRKTMTLRNKKYGKLGDVFYVGKGQKVKCRILGVYKQRLGDIYNRFWWLEGFRSKKEFKDFWLTIHRKWQPEKKYYLHVFERV